MLIYKLNVPEIGDAGKGCRGTNAPLLTNPSSVAVVGIIPKYTGTVLQPIVLNEILAWIQVTRPDNDKKPVVFDTGCNNWQTASPIQLLLPTLKQQFQGCIPYALENGHAQPVPQQPRNIVWVAWDDDEQDIL